MNKEGERNMLLVYLERTHLFMILLRDLSAVFKDFLIKLCYSRKVVVVMDHAPYHISYKMQKFYAGNKNSLHVKYFPSYSPELNPAEIPWKEAKKWLERRCWNNKDG